MPLFHAKMYNELSFQRKRYEVSEVFAEVVVCGCRTLGGLQRFRFLEKSERCLDGVYVLDYAGYEFSFRNAIIMGLGYPL